MCVVTDCVVMTPSSGPRATARVLAAHIGARGLLHAHEKRSLDNKRGKRSADRRTSVARISGCGRAPCVLFLLRRLRGRLGGGALASRRSTAALAKAFTPWLSPDRASCAPDRCLVGLPGPQCSELLADRSSCRTGGVLSRPGAGLRAPRASAALAPINGRHRLTSLTEQDLLHVSENESIVNIKATIFYFCCR